MKKRVLTLFLALAMCFGLAVPAFASSGDFVIEKGVLTKYNGPGSLHAMIEEERTDPGGDIVIPGGVIEIGEYAFQACTADSITIPKGVTTICTRAFAYAYVPIIIIPDSVTQIGVAAFDHCDLLTTVTIPGSVATISDGAFELCCGLTSAIICDGVKEIGAGAFSYCAKLASVTIPSSVTTIGEDAFEGCDNLTIHGKAGSYAERYARENSIPFVEAGAANPSPDPEPAPTPDTVPTPTPSFTDTPAWCAKEAQWAVEQGITNGAGGATTFAPTLECTHDQILTFLWRAEGKPAAAKAPVTAASYYQYAIDWAYEKGFIDNSFQPSAPCTRAQAVWYIWKALGEPNASKAASFTDVDAGADYAAAVSWAVEKGVTKGYGGEDTFAPDRVCGRGEIVCFLHRAYT